MAGKEKIDVRILRYTENGQKRYMAASCLLVLILSIVNAYVHEIEYMLRKKEYNYSWSELYNYFIDFYPNVNSPFSLLLELFSFLSTLAIALAVVVEGEGKMLILSKFSYWLCVGSCSVLAVMSRALFSGLGVIKAIAVIVSSIIILYYLGRFSIVIGQKNFINARMAFDKSVSLIYLKLYERYGGERSAARSLVKVFVLLSILLIMAIGPWVLLITDALSATRYDNGNILSVLLVFLFIYCLTFVALLKNEEHGMNGLLLVTSCIVPLLPLLFYVFHSIHNSIHYVIIFFIALSLSFWSLFCVACSRMSSGELSEKLRKRRPWILVAEIESIHSIKARLYMKIHLKYIDRVEYMNGLGGS